MKLTYTNPEKDPRYVTSASVGDKVIFMSHGEHFEGTIARSIGGEIFEVQTGKEMCLVAANDILKANGWRMKHENYRTKLRDINPDKLWWNK